MKARNKVTARKARKKGRRLRHVKKENTKGT